MKIRDIMTADVTRLAPQDSCREAARLMAACDCGCIPVADDDKLVGVVTDRDIAVRLVAQGRHADTPAREIMTDRILYCYEDQDIAEVAANMSEQQVRRFPVVSRDKRLVGIVSLGDIALKNQRNAGRALQGISQPMNGHAEA